MGASMVFLLLLMVLAQGWTVSRFEVIYPKMLLGSVIGIALLECALYVWILIGLDMQKTTYIYNTVPEYANGALFIVMGIGFVAQCLLSYKNEPLGSKRNLYVLLAIFFSFWFLWPLLRIVVGDGFKPWNRDVAIVSISLTINTLTYFIMMLLMWPTWAHQYFNLSMVDSGPQLLDSGANATDIVKKADYKVLEQDRL